MPTLALVLNAQPKRQITKEQHVDANACTRLERSTVKTDHGGESTWMPTLAFVLNAQLRRLITEGRARGCQRLHSS